MIKDIALGIFIGLLFVCLIVMFCALIIKLYINKVTNYTKLIYQKDIDYQKSLNTTILETQEQVLTNISSELHDDAGQQLTYINLQIENLKLDLPQLQEKLIPLSQSVSNLSQSIRSISHSLNNQILLQQDLIKAITAEVERINKNGKIEFTVEVNNSPKRNFNSNQQIVLYRIFQESINNILKHSKATKVQIYISAYPKFIMTITDDGKGFNYESKKEDNQTLGLNSISNKAKIIDFEATFYSKPNEGTTVTITELLNE